MCGIVGQVGPGACGQESLLRMMGMLTHRGPDEAGFLLDEDLAFGHLRLSIVDLASGQQPMASADGRYWITFNGEIFNHVELRRELESAGHTFRTRSDTEVLLTAFHAWGPAALDRFNGQWAFALWDRQTRTTFLARDRFGVRPLFYTLLDDGRTLLFASEIKALFADGRVPRAWNPDALTDVLASWACEGDRTPFAGIRQLPAGSWMRVRDGRIETRKWWDIDYSPDVIEWSRTDESWQDELRATLDEACRLRLRADVTVGTYLSGGLDSSITTWISKTRHQPDLQTFSIGFRDEGFDESPYQALLASQLGTDHHSISVGREEIAAGLDAVAWHTETPMHRTAPIPLMRLSGLVRSHGLKVVLTGEGADEVFGGYDQFKENKVRRFWARSPGSPWRRRLLDRLEGNVPRTGSRTRAFWYAFFEQGLQETGRPGYSHHPRWRNGLSLLPLLADAQAAARHPAEWMAAVEATVPDGFEGWDPLSQAQYWEMRQFLAGYLLSSQGDRVAMAHSVEGRYPFLDVQVFELSRRMPPRLKMRVLREKDILKRTFAAVLPSAIVNRPKYPYRAPDAMALVHGPDRERILAGLTPAAVARRGLFRPEAVTRLLDRVERSEQPPARDNMALVFVCTAHAVHDQFIDRPMQPAALPPITTRIDLRTTAGSLEYHTS